MRNTILMIITYATIMGANAQVANDNVVLGAGYTDEVFYSLITQTKTAVAQSSWDIGLVTSLMSGAIIANPNTVEVYLNPNIDSSGYASAWDTTNYTSWPKLYNSENSWYMGAFNQTANISNPFDFGWGIYDFSTHTVNGDSVYLLKKGPVFIKLWIKRKSDTNVYTLRGGLLDGTGDITFDLDANPYTTKNFFYYSIGAFSPTDPEPTTNEWDLLFTHYMSDIPFAGWYPVVGVYSNLSTKVAQAIPVDTASVLLTDYMDNFTPSLTEIGYDWKYFDMYTFQYVLVDSLVYFVSVQDSSRIYSMIFTGFDNTTGTIDFRTELLWSAVGINEVTGILEQAAVYPNPVQQQLNIAYSAAESGNVEVNLVDVAGQEVFSNRFFANQGFHAVQLEVPELADGIYLLKLTENENMLSLKVVISK